MALTDKSGLFYVGKTKNASTRFTNYRKGALDSPNNHLIRRLRDAGDDLRVTILDYMPADLSAAEIRLITVHAERLVNIQANPYRAKAQEHTPRRSGLKVSVGRLSTLATCPCCDGPHDNPNKEYCKACQTKYFRNRGQVRQRALELSALAKAG